MQIPNINTLRKNARKDIIDKNSQELNKIIEKRKKTRSKWSEKDNQKFDKYLQDLKTAHCNYIEALKNEIIIKTKLVINDNPNAEGFNLEEPQFIDADIDRPVRLWPSAARECEWIATLLPLLAADQSGDCWVNQCRRPFDWPALD